MSTSNLFEQTTSFSKLCQVGTFTSFVELQEIFDRLTHVYTQDAPKGLLNNLTQCGVKLAFSSDGYRTVALNGPNIESPPRPFTFAHSGFVDRPAKSIDANFFPLVHRDNLSLYFAHELRWFRHPVRPNVMIPLRLRSHFLSVSHPSSRIYVDVPVVFETDQNTVNFIRVSLNVFEEIIFAQSDGDRKFVRLSRNRNGSAVRTIAEPTTTPIDESHLWKLHDLDYMDYYCKNKEFIEHQPKYWSSAMLVADHLINQRT